MTSVATIQTRSRISALAAKFGHILAVEARQTALRRGEFIGRAIFFILLMLIFSRLYAALAGDAEGGLSASDMLWYIAGTEWIALGVPLVHLDIEKEVRNGDIAYRLARPVSYVWARLAEGTGSMLARMAMLLAIGFPFTWLLAGSLPPAGWATLLVLPFGIAAGILLLMFKIMIGMSAVWMQDVSPAFWVWQKLMFFFGGLLVPITLYPGWMQEISAWTPFNPILYGTGSVAGGCDLAHTSIYATRLVVWLVVASLLLTFTFSRASRRLDINGG